MAKSIAPMAIAPMRIGRHATALEICRVGLGLFPPDAPECEDLADIRECADIARLALGSDGP